VVVDPAFDWEDDRPPDRPYQSTIIYEAHVKGLTIKKPGIPEEIRGSYSALASPEMIRYLNELGITAIELMPAHYFISDRHLEDKGLTNYWGYNTIGYFAPDNRYASTPQRGEQVREFKQMVKQLHRAGIEVIMDVVYNHTAEGNQLGPTVCFRGIDNPGYYRLTENKRYYMDYTGTGNTLNSMMPNVLRLIMDSLRYWITEMHVDGFRFDLASTLARELHEVDRLGSFFDIIHQDPVISQVKLIAEPWDLGEGGYQVGKFPPEWAEWNGLYRDAVRDFWRGEENKLPEFAERFTGSADLYKNELRRPTASINFITAHDGFTLNDLVSYNEKHNEANLDNNTDGESHNRSNNWGTEGPTEDAGILALRKKIKQNFLATLFLSQGIPMLPAGDEMGRTQQGNNNSYCQDNEISWINWEQADQDLFAFCRDMIAFRKKHPVFSRRRWFKGKKLPESGQEDIAWFSPEGKQMCEEQWADAKRKALGVFYSGLGLRSATSSGEPAIDDDFFIIFNAGDTDVSFVLPPEQFGKAWEKLMDTRLSNPEDKPACYEAGKPVETENHSLIVLKANKQTI
jgi:glycogen operon protein